MKPYLTDRSTAYKKYTAFLFNSLKTKTQPIPRRILSEMFKEGKNVKHFTRMENNFNQHVVPLIIGYNSTWEEKAHMFFVTATPVLGTDLKAKFEMIGTLELDGNSRMARFDSANFSLQRNESHTAYHKPMSDKARRENTKVQDEAFEKFMGQINENNAALDFNNDEMNEATSHLRQEVLKFLMMFLNFLGQRFPEVKATVAQVAEKVIQFDDYFDENLKLSAVSVQLCVIHFVELLTLDNNNADHGPETKSVLETLKNLLKNERSLHLVHDSLEEFLQEKFNSMDHNMNQEPLNPVDHARPAMDNGNDVLMEVGDEAADPVYADDNNDGHIGVDHQVEGQEALVPVEDADPPMDNGDDGRMPVGEEEADLINEYRAFFDALGYYHPEDDREALVPVEDARQPVDNENDDYMGVRNVAVNRMDGFLANDYPMRINRQVELNPVEIDHPAVNHGRADHPLVENAEANRIVTDVGKAVFSDLRTREFCLESFKFLEKFVETFKSYQGCKTMKRLDEVLEYVTSHQSDPRRYETGTLSMSFFYSKVKETFQRLFHQNLANNARYNIFERKFQRGLLCSDLVSHFCDSLDRSPTMKVFSVPVREECSRMLTNRNTIIPYEKIVDELWRFHQKIKFSLVKRAN
ncbi:hypothetical protein CAEBREN_11267 [Caenorhabditis brenneri]|uniref:SPK domain-containing protein n=1 Tax=Caenorhabditis brenneri TaxID=135651 RepID=G0MAX7_CAEBE|nr:hypothetical protein CAEBREN_11267 [Caenorhabditis brenneri]